VPNWSALWGFPVTEPEIRQVLQDAVRDVLEKMFFAIPLEEPDEAGFPADGIAVELAFEGDPSGALLLSMSSPAARQIAADFLGIDESEVSAAQTTDVVCELANMICGSVLSRVESTARFRLASPRVLSPTQELSACVVGTPYCVHLTGGVLAVQLDTGIAICHPPVPSAY
jgi:CheY-specific phosphatase CheX